MAVTTDVSQDQLFERAGELKRELVEFSQLPRFRRAFEEGLAQWQADADPDAPADVIERRLLSFWDHFVLEYRLRNGATVLEQFLAARLDLPKVERQLLRR